MQTLGFKKKDREVKGPYGGVQETIGREKGEYD
jgi:hypothetical protein